MQEITIQLQSSLYAGSCRAIQAAYPDQCWLQDCVHLVQHVHPNHGLGHVQRHSQEVLVGFKLPRAVDDRTRSLVERYRGGVIQLDERRVAGGNKDLDGTKRAGWWCLSQDGSKSVLGLLLGESLC